SGDCCRCTTFNSKSVICCHYSIPKENNQIRDAMKRRQKNNRYLNYSSGVSILNSIDFLLLEYQLQQSIRRFCYM
uniref:Uncharacterized protein n=1 Tax=Romanomermis culicivorax TaxID=13658 RepID=A0A915KK40_ROMCU